MDTDKEILFRLILSVENWEIVYLDSWKKHPLTILIMYSRNFVLTGKAEFWILPANKSRNYSDDKRVSKSRGFDIEARHILSEHFLNPKQFKCLLRSQAVSDFAISSQEKLRRFVVYHLCNRKRTKVICRIDLQNENEGHGFRNEENRFEFYTEMEKVLKKHLQ